MSQVPYRLRYAAGTHNIHFHEEIQKIIHQLSLSTPYICFNEIPHDYHFELFFSIDLNSLTDEQTMTINRALDKREYLMMIFLISHRNHML